MNFEIKTDENEERGARSVVKPPDFTSKAIRIRLLMLFGMLILVIILMKEAGKPERWSWMGFEDGKVDTNTVLRKSMSDGQATVDQQNPSPPVDAVATDSAANAAGNAKLMLGANVTLENNDAPFPVAAERFWKELFQRMNPEQQQSLFGLVRNLRLGKSLPESELASYKKLVGLIASHRTKHHRDMFDQLALLPDSSEQKTVLANELYESQELWEKKILPAFQSSINGEDFSVSQLQQIGRLQQVLDPYFLGIVQDHTSIGWVGDSPAWVRLWERVANKDFRSVVPATHLQLSSQPKHYRGQTVEIQGWVRAARQEHVKEGSELGLPGYTEMWMRPADTKLAPYCVYALNLPTDFPEVTDQFQDMNVRVNVSGLFFKVRTYVDAEKEVRESPVVLANSFEVIPDYVPASVNNWQPKRSTLIGLLLLIPIVATAIAWFAYRTTETRRYQPGKSTSEKIEKTLGGLADDPNVQTDREKIMQLYSAGDAEDETELGNNNGF